MTRYLLDTSIISDAIKPVPSESLAAWISEQRDEDLFIAALTIGELRRGLLEKTAGKKRDQLERWFAGTDGPLALFTGRILPFEETAALIWARLMAEGTAAVRPRSGIHMILAATAEANECILVTDNERHFSGIRFINPLRPSRI